MDGGEQDAGVPVGAVDEGREVAGFSSLECVAVGGDVMFVGFGVNGEAGSFMVRSSGVYQEAELVNETEEVFQGARESRESERMEWSMMA